MRIYFINPNETDTRMYYKEVPDDMDVNKIIKLDIGYADLYEMRKVKLPSAYFSTNADILQDILEKRKNKRVIKAYKDLITTLKTEVGNKHRVISHNSIEAPF